jgi:3-deoxy-manno-octulosonate cytidylyltransferase (CMP-KDO synthetase)
MVVAIIPVRYASTRLPGKPLVDLCGQSMLERVWRAATSATLIDRVVVATDDDRIVVEARRIGADVCRTSPTCASGTDRCFEALGYVTVPPTLVVNVQGDEPLLEGGTLDGLVDAALRSGADVTTLVRAIELSSDLANPNMVKVVRGASGNALFFSRSAVPYIRDVPCTEWLQHTPYWQHIGLYAYTPQALALHVSLPPSHLEQLEGLEQLRLLEKGASFHCVETTANLKAVDTPADAEEVRRILRART